ncbi:MAG: hypothetical protein ABW166_04665 [Sedimenticola sp.]
MVDITITGGRELPANTLFYPPDLKSDLKGNKASDWIDGQLPVSKYEAILKARAANSPLWDSMRWEAINTDIPLYENGSGPQTYPPSVQVTVNSWIKNNWKWLVPVVIGTAFIISRR